MSNLGRGRAESTRRGGSRLRGRNGRGPARWFRLACRLDRRRPHGGPIGLGAAGSRSGPCSAHAGRKGGVWGPRRPGPGPGHGPESTPLHFRAPPGPPLGRGRRLLPATPATASASSGPPHPRRAHKLSSAANSGQSGPAVYGAAESGEASESGGPPEARMGRHGAQSAWPPGVPGAQGGTVQQPPAPPPARARPPSRTSAGHSALPRLTTPGRGPRGAPFR